MSYQTKSNRGSDESFGRNGMTNNNTTDIVEGLTPLRGLETIPRSVDPSPAVRAEQLVKVYGTGDAAVHAVRGVNIELPRGEITVLMGPSGSGKSTLLYLLAALDAPTSGSIWLEGRSTEDIGDAALARWRAKHVGFVLQRNNLVPTLTIEENVAAPLMLAGWRRQPALERAREALSEVGLIDRRDHWPSGVSGGEAQRAAVARACAGEPRVIFADEPTGALDSASGQIVLEIFRRMTKSSGAAALLVTHDQRACDAGDRVLHFVDGQVGDGRHE
jgi:ABC-type lipoprotein export system ATPase subunit